MLNLIHGDCLEEMKNIPDKSINVSFTSPPYNRKRNDKYTNYNDVVVDYYGWMCTVIDELLRVTDGYVFFNIQKNYYNKPDVFKLIGKYSEQLQEIIIWEKSNPMPASGHAITNAHEYFLVLGNKPLKSNTTYTKNIITTSVNSKMTKEHKAVMHQGVADWFIQKFTQPNDVVLDCFMGLGTTGVACSKFGRDFIGIELDESYLNCAKERILKTDIITD